MGGRDEILEQNFIQKKLKRGDNIEYIQNTAKQLSKFQGNGVPFCGMNSECF